MGQQQLTSSIGRNEEVKETVPNECTVLCRRTSAIESDDIGGPLLSSEIFAVAKEQEAIPLLDFHDNLITHIDRHSIPSISE